MRRSLRRRVRIDGCFSACGEDGLDREEDSDGVLELRSALGDSSE